MKDYGVKNVVIVKKGGRYNMYYIIIADLIVRIHPDKGKAEEMYEAAKKLTTKGTPMCMAKAIFNGVGIMEPKPEPKKEIKLNAGVQYKEET